MGLGVPVGVIAVVLGLVPKILSCNLKNETKEKTHYVRALLGLSLSPVRCHPVLVATAVFILVESHSLPSSSSSPSSFLVFPAVLAVVRRGEWRQKYPEGDSEMERYNISPSGW